MEPTTDSGETNETHDGLKMSGLPRTKGWREQIERAIGFGLTLDQIRTWLGKPAKELSIGDFNRFEAELTKLQTEEIDLKQFLARGVGEKVPRGGAIGIVLGDEAIPAMIKPDALLLELLRQKGIEMPTLADVDIRKTQIDYMAFPPEVKELEDAEKFKFAWLPKPTTEGDKQQLMMLHRKHGPGFYIWVTRADFGEMLPDHLFGELGAIERGDSWLAVMRRDVWNELQRQRVHAAAQKARDAQDGAHEDGKPPEEYLVYGGSIDQGTEMTIPNVPGVTNEKGELIAELFHGE